MIDLKAARNDPETVRAALERKGAGDSFDALLEADERWRALVPRIDELRGRTKVKGKPSPEQLAELQQVKEELKAAEEELATAEEERDRLALRVPNLPRDDVPSGATEDDALELRRVGEPAVTDGAREHLEIGRFDMERAARMSGARFGYWIGDTARLALALYRLALDRLAAKGFVTVLPPGRSGPTRRTSTRWRPSGSTSPAPPRSGSRASTPARSSTPTSCRSATSPSHPASGARPAPPAATRGG